MSSYASKIMGLKAVFGPHQNQNNENDKDIIYLQLSCQVKSGKGWRFGLCGGNLKQAKIIEANIVRINRKNDRKNTKQNCLLKFIFDFVYRSSRHSCECRNPVITRFFLGSGSPLRCGRNGELCCRLIIPDTGTDTVPSRS